MAKILNYKNSRQINTKNFEEIKKILSPLELRSDLLIEHLHLIQDSFGHISEDSIISLSTLLKLSMVEVYEVATFYAHFDVIKEGERIPPKFTIRVCDSLSCELSGSNQLKKILENEFNIDEVRVLRAPCMGRCYTAPTVEIGHNHVDYADLKKVKKAIDTNDIHPKIPEYEEYKDYILLGGYETLIKVKKIEKSNSWFDHLTKSGLRGLGGAGFNTARKWNLVSSEKGSKFVAVNADEGEPGTFKDRHYLEKEPHMFLEGMLLAAHAINAEKCFIYLRDEYPAILKILKKEILNLEINNIIPKNYIDLRRGAGAYICGEESAMIESIEGKKGLPRHRPPFVASVGIFNRPTLVHNVETLYWIAKIVRGGPDVFGAHGVNGRKGLRSYSVSGRVCNPGVKLAPAGTTVRELIEDYSGGMLEGHKFKAYQPGGPSSGLLPASMGEIPLDFDTLQEYGTFIGSAAVVILSDQDSAKAAALNMLRFFEDESCGQCTPCRVGCEKAVKLMSEDKWDQGLLEELSVAMVDASICGLGQAAPNPIRMVIKHFSDEI